MPPQNPTYNFPPANSNRGLFRRRNLYIALGVIGFLSLVWLSWAQIINKHTVTLQPSNGVTITIGTPASNDVGGRIQRVLGVATTASKKVRLSTGVYQVLYSANGYVGQYNLVDLSSDITLTPPKLTYSQSKLQSLLASQRNTIHNALGSAMDIKTNNYSFANEQLYADATWYSSQLIPADTSQQDQQVVIMHKQNNTWKLVAGPKIVLFIGDYPNIPQEVIRSVNNPPTNGQ